MKKLNIPKGLFSKYSDKKLLLSTIALVIFGSFMIVSAEMGNSVGDTSVITSTTIKQLIFGSAAFIAMIICSHIRIKNIPINIAWAIYGVILAALLITRAFGAVGGAYGWIRIGGYTIQPSEFAKVYIVLFAAILFSKDNPKTNMLNFYRYLFAVIIYFVIIFAYQNDFGSAFVLLIIATVCFLIPNRKEYKKIQNILVGIIIVCFIGATVVLSPIGTKLLEKMGGNYRVARFLASANPFAYLYDDGYHLVMSLVSFATGGLKGEGYGNGFHKYMNFPNPSTDFILPVIVEELGIIGFLIIVFLYLVIMLILIKYSIKTRETRTKIVLLGVFMYFAVHFILNAGGVSGFIPLTGVPLLIISYGGSSLVAVLSAIGFAESEIISYKESKDENNSRQI